MLRMFFFRLARLAYKATGWTWPAFAVGRMYERHYARRAAERRRIGVTA